MQVIVWCLFCAIVSNLFSVLILGPGIVVFLLTSLGVASFECKYRGSRSNKMCNVLFLQLKSDSKKEMYLKDKWANWKETELWTLWLLVGFWGIFCQMCMIEPLECEIKFQNAQMPQSQLSVNQICFTINFKHWCFSDLMYLKQPNKAESRYSAAWLTLHQLYIVELYFNGISGIANEIKPGGNMIQERNTLTNVWNALWQKRESSHESVT